MPPRRRVAAAMIRFIYADIFAFDADAFAALLMLSFDVMLPPPLFRRYATP